jgi:hypothetical protein
VRLFCDDAGGNYPIIVVINFDGFWQTGRWNQEGKSDCVKKLYYATAEIFVGRIAAMQELHLF